MENITKYKLSENILKGLEIAGKEGIQLGKGCIIASFDDTCQMCALGLALLPVLGKDRIEEMYFEAGHKPYDFIQENFEGAKGFNDCLGEKVVSFVFYRNDAGMHPKEIAEKLAECGL